MFFAEKAMFASIQRVFRFIAHRIFPMEISAEMPF
jgi:hypothetical protein